MQITRVELDNIKNYETGSFDLGPGITAICGPNGSGKTTILEAVSWALFDQLPYKKEDFLRRGARKGSVRVTFISSLDGREYTVCRDTGAGYYIYDPVTRIRLVEQKGQVAGWIRQHLGVDPSIDLKSLFTSAIGVPQGTFTLDFSDQPSKRKIEFDKVLRVDDYQRCSDDLLPLVRFVEARLAGLREDIARCEVRVAALSDLVDERRRLEAAIRKLESEIPSLEIEREYAKQEVERLDALARQIERLNADKAALESRISEADRRLVTLADEVMRSRAAVAAVNAAADGFNAYSDAAKQLSELESESAVRDRIKAELAEKERQQIRLHANLQNLREKLSELMDNKDALQALAPLIEAQCVLEARLRELRTAAGEATSLQERLVVTERELDSLRAEYRDISRRLDECQKLKGVAARAAGLEVARSGAESELRGKQLDLERLSQRKVEQGKVIDAIAKQELELQNLEQTIDSSLPHDQIVLSIAALETDERQTVEEIANIRAALELDERTLGQIKDGLCPLLAQRCLNMREGETLDTYFRGRAVEDRNRLSALQSHKDDVQQQLSRTRAAAMSAGALDNLRAQHARYRNELEEQRAKSEALAKEIASLKVNPDLVRQVAERLKATERELRAAQDAKARLEAAAPLKERLTAVEADGAQKRALLKELDDRLTSSVKAKGELSAAEREIEALENPRGRAKLLEARISNEPALRDALARSESDGQALDDIISSLQGRLEMFASLDALLAAQRDRRAASEKDYRTFIENQPIAALLPTREEEYDALKRSLDADVERSEGLTSQLDCARSDYDGNRHLDAKTALDLAVKRASAAVFERDSLLERVSVVARDIAELGEVKKKLDELTTERRQSEEILAVSELTRDVLKKAAPFVTEALLQSISLEANQLYRDITGNPMATLRWDSGYEIVLEEDGYDRPFANLSGGEQMSAALAIRLALLKELSDVRIAFFDEPTTNMDEERRRNLAEQIGRIKDFDQLFVISHDDAFEGFTDRMIVLEAPAHG